MQTAVVVIDGIIVYVMDHGAIIIRRQVRVSRLIKK